MADEPRAGLANPLTLASVGVIAYVTETLLHEAGGHGTLCLLTGGEITLLAPLYMRCSTVALQMVAAGPAMNLLAGLVSYLLLRARRNAEAGPGGYFIWLCLVFNWLVAAGYCLVGAIMGFGDWGVVFANVQPDWLWRVPAGAIALLFYWATLHLAAREFSRLSGLGAVSKATQGKLVLVPTGAAALVAMAAEIYGQNAQPLGIGLTFGCTLFIGLTLLTMNARGTAMTVAGSRLRLGFSPGWTLAAVLVAAGFILFVGPGAVLSRL